MWRNHQVKSSIYVSMINLKMFLNIFSNFTFAFIYLFIAKNNNFIQQWCTQLIKSDFYKRLKITISNKMQFFLFKKKKNFPFIKESWNNSFH